MFPSHVNSGFHIVSQNDELGRPAVVVAAKTNDVDLGHMRAENSEKLIGEQEGLDLPIAIFRGQARRYAVPMTRQELEEKIDELMREMLEYLSTG